MSRVLLRRLVSPASRWPWRAWALAVLAYAALRPLVGLGHELAVALVASALHAGVATGFWEPLIAWLGLDPIYTGAAVRAAGGVHVLGLAVAGPLGGWLHAVLPQVFLRPEFVTPGAGVSMVAAPGAPALGHGLAAFGADVGWLALGTWLFWRWRQRRWPVALIGLLIDAQIAINHLLDAQVGLHELEASGLPFALALALPGDGTWFTTRLAELPPNQLNLLVGACLLAMGLACAAVLVALVGRLERLAGRARRRPWPIRQPARRPPAAWLAGLGSALAVLAALSPLGALALGESNWQTIEARVGITAPRSLAAPRVFATDGPTVVTIEQTGPASWRYLVDGRPQVIRGVGYNPQYASLDPASRAQVYQRDFSAMRQAGINTIEGWFETQFDEVTLDAAASNGIGVLMPFELNQDWPYENPNVQQSILDHVSAYVERYKDNPAVRMWAPGNEDLHRILYPNWVSKEHDPVASARADAFAAFLPVLVDRIHELDPDHPVIYRDAEDVYLGRLKAAFKKTGVARPWLVYGANVYAARRLQEIVNTWPNQWLPAPLVISEFAPGGVGPAERPLGFQLDWTTLRQRPQVVLGGLAYTWATNGPEQLDRVFGLVDPQGVPTDGALAALSAIYQSDAAATAQDPGQG
jgi:hypothetical protein